MQCYCRPLSSLALDVLPMQADERVVGQDRELGSIVAGKIADLVLVDGDAATRISDIRRPTLVIARGHAYEPAKLS